MGRRYYCDYCDRSFIDEIDSRKKHLIGVSHERLKKIYYSKLRDLKTLVKEERQKEICRRFRNIGFCPFEESCTFTHYSPQELSAFELQVEYEERRKNQLPILPSVNEWLARKAERNTKETLAAVSIYSNNNPLNNYNYNLLPPSLRPIVFEQMENTKFFEWG